jgi:NAD(P)-dependent dehydrogenase (short-subunit alcohol dehydrogenase family)
LDLVRKARPALALPDRPSIAVLPFNNLSGDPEQEPAELATAYVMLADPLSSYVSGAPIAVTGGKPIL